MQEQKHAAHMLQAWGKVCADNDNPVYQIEINEINGLASSRPPVRMLDGRDGATGVPRS
jgi:hypothetical protein